MAGLTITQIGQMRDAWEAADGSLIDRMELWRTGSGLHLFVDYQDRFGYRKERNISITLPDAKAERGAEMSLADLLSRQGEMLPLPLKDGVIRTGEREYS